MISYPAHSGIMQQDSDRISTRICVAVVGCMSLMLWTAIAAIAVRLV